MNTQVVQQSQDRYGILRRAIQSNGAFSGLSGLVFALGGKAVAAFIGLDSSAVLTGLGIVLILYAVDLFWVASRPEIDRRLGWTAVILDIVWVVGSYAILLAGWPPLTLAGKWTIALLAEVVGVFAIWQYIGLRRAR
ncbi:MAG: hypothetical protein GY803_00435 [Chloroflexi bacterium]|nr:hypothetical protein [Chloroflexota bacterium]